MPDNKPIAWSHSRLETFKNCPKRFYHQYVVKDIQDTFVHPAAAWGSEVHEAIELNIRDGKPMPANMTQYQPYADLSKQLPNVEAEVKMAVNSSWEPVDFSDYQNAWGRAISDVLSVAGDTAVVFDWKGLALDTPIPTPTGMKTMGQLVVGDYVYGRDGEQAKVVGKSDVKNIGCYAVSFANGETIVCDEEHLWLRSDGKVVHSRGLEPEKRRRSVPTAQALQNAEVDLPIPPFTLGMWLADGRTSGRSEICKPDPEVWDAIEAEGFTVGPDISSENRTTTRSVYGLSKLLRREGLAGVKYIPQVYYTASYAQRLALVSGLMSGDGSVNKTRGELCYTTTDHALAKDVARLLRTMGVQASIIPHTSKGFGKEVQAYYVNSRLLDENIMVPAHKAAAEAQVRAAQYPKNTRNHTVVSVEKIPSVPTQCIAVDSADNTFLCGATYIPTHNTGKYRGHSEQAAINAVLTFMTYPTVNVVYTRFVYFKEGISDPGEFHREQIPELIAPTMQTLANIQQCQDLDTWPTQPSGLCGFCPVRSCQYNRT